MTEQQIIVALMMAMIIIAGIFLWQAAIIWLRNKREERAWQMERAELRRADANAAEREAWVTCLNKKDELIAGLNEELIKMTKQLEQNKKVMSKVNLKGEQI